MFDISPIVEKYWVPHCTWWPHFIPRIRLFKQWLLSNSLFAVIKPRSDIGYKVRHIWIRKCLRLQKQSDDSSLVFCTWINVLPNVLTSHIFSWLITIYFCIKILIHFTFWVLIISGEILNKPISTSFQYGLLNRI